MEQEYRETIQEKRQVGERTHFHLDPTVQPDWTDPRYGFIRIDGQWRTASNYIEYQGKWYLKETCINDYGEWKPGRKKTPPLPSRAVDWAPPADHVAYTASDLAARGMDLMDYMRELDAANVAKRTSQIETTIEATQQEGF